MRSSLLSAAFALLARGASGLTCDGEGACKARLADLVDQLNASHQSMASRGRTLGVLEGMRTSLASGERVELPSVHRAHLELGGAAVDEISFDAKHRPVSTNMSRHLQRVRTLAAGQEVRFHAFLSLKRRTKETEGPGPLLITIDKDSLLWVHSVDGDALVSAFNLGHGRVVTHMQISPSQDSHFVLTADDQGDMRVHALKVTLDDSKSNTTKVPAADSKQRIKVTPNHTATFALPQSSAEEKRRLTAVIPVEGRGAQYGFVAGDDRGGMSAFSKNGTLKGRIIVTADPGGVRGLQRGSGQTVLFWSSHSFGFLSTNSLDVQHPACDGWQSPVHEAILESGTRVILALEDGNVLVFSTTHGKNKACDLVLKFPHTVKSPLSLQLYRGHVIALPVVPAKVYRELHFFNPAAMDSGYGSAASRAVALQASFRPHLPEAFALHGGGSAAQSRGLLALRMAGEKGVELYELALKQPAPSRVMSSSGGGAAESSSGGSWLDWFPKIGVFGIALVGVVIWNVRKVTNQKRHDKGDDFDEETFKKQFKDRKAKKDAEKETGKAGDGDQ